MDEPPLIATLALDQGAFDWFDDLRRRHFPPGRNRVPAHVTLFHTLPGAELEAVRQAIEDACAATPPLTLAVTAPRSLGNGVAYTVVSDGLAGLRARLAKAFGPWLTAQDRQPFRPHITVQNKATPEAARTLLLELQTEFEPVDITGEGVALWRYLGGPWEPLARIPFSAAGAGPPLPGSPPSWR